MGMFELTVRGRFCGAHRLAGYVGRCADLHGHNWDVEVTVRGRELDPTGLLVDFRVLKEALRAVLDEIDHTDLNRIPEFQGQNPTSENLARYLYARLAKQLHSPRWRIDRVAVSETPEVRAVYCADEEPAAP